MFRRLLTWWRNRNLVPVYGWESGPKKRPVPVVLRYVKRDKTVRPSEWPAPEPKRLTRLGMTDADIQKSARQWRVDHLPDECAFL